MDIIVPADFKWKAGQHCWLRFPHLSILHNHPFTIASLRNVDQASEKEMRDQNLRFYIRSYSGLTKAIASSTARTDQNLDQTRTVHIDGPYGGQAMNFAKRYDQLIFVAGGGGISACLPLMLEAAIYMSKGKAHTQCIHLIWMVREQAHLQWTIEELNEIKRVASTQRVNFKFFVTEEASPTASSEDITSGKEVAKTNSKPLPTELGEVHHRRPFLLDFLPNLLEGRRIMIYGCGPESLKIDLSNTAYNAQRRVIHEELDELALHTETFGW